MKPIHSTDAHTIGGHAFDSRLLIGTGKYPADDMIPKIIAASGSQIITVALRRVDFEATTDNVMRHIPADMQLLPNTSGARNAEEAVSIAAHVADIAKGIPGARDWDDAMGRARADLDWKRMLNLAMDPEKATRYRESSQPVHEDSCTMCGKMCAVRNMNRVLAGKDIQLND